MEISSPASSPTGGVPRISWSSRAPSSSWRETCRRKRSRRSSPPLSGGKMRTLVAVVLMAAAAVAQQQDPNRIAEFQANRLKDRLKLSDDQTSKLKEIFLKEAEDRAKSDEARTAKINELLDDEQKKLYEEYRRNRGGGFGGGGQQFQFGGGRGGQFGQQGLVQMDDLKRELTLTDEQLEKIKPLVDEFNAPLQKRMEEFRGGTFNWQNFDWQGELS